MKKITLSALLFVTLFTSKMFAEELGLKLSNLQYYKYAAVADKSSGDGIHKGLIQMDLSFNLGSHGPVAAVRRGVYYYGPGVGFRPGFTFNIDGAVHPYVSVGGYFGLDGRYGIVGIGFGARGVFHIYQLIADKANTKVSPGKLDFYFPLHMGGLVYAGNGFHSGGFAIGAGLGVRYYPAPRIGVMFEVGWLEMCVAKIGMAIKL